jgi:hypothetical protein
MWIECPYRSVILGTGSIAAACSFIAVGMTIIGSIV